jgi:hypothetical protein
MPVAERQQKPGTTEWFRHHWRSITGRIGAVASTRKGADAGRVSLRGLDEWKPVEPKDKLDATVADQDGMVNGPEDGHLGWDAILWREAEENVRRLRQRIFAASQTGDLKKVRNLQKLMLRSRSNALVSVRRVTEVNAGRKTAGIDGKVMVTSEQKADLVSWMLSQAKPWSPRSVKRVYVPKSNGRRRPLGIHVIVDRCLQALTVNALEPEWEAWFEPKSWARRCMFPACTPRYNSAASSRGRSQQR